MKTEQERYFITINSPGYSTIIISSYEEKFITGEFSTTYFIKTYEEKRRNSIGRKILEIEECSIQFQQIQD